MDFPGEIFGFRSSANFGMRISAKFRIRDIGKKVAASAVYGALVLPATVFGVGTVGGTGLGVGVGLNS